jgi:hypothetical protein
VKRILIAGGIEDDNQGGAEFAKSLGQEVVSQGHVLINACLTPFDKLVAQGAYEWLQGKGLNAREWIKSYVLVGKVPIHKYGNILRSQLASWDNDTVDLYVPEPIKIADAVILVGGWEGTTRAANWARIDNKPVLPVTALEGKAASLYNGELNRVSQGKYAGRIEQADFEVLNQVPGEGEWEKFAHDVISLAEKITSSKYVFIIMSFSEKPIFRDALAAFQEVCKDCQYEANRIDQLNPEDRIVSGIFESIRRAAFVIADVSEQKSNVYYELGYAHGLNKPLIVTAYKGTELPFDVNDVPTIYWESQVDFKEKLKAKIKEIASQQGRER